MVYSEQDGVSRLKMPGDMLYSREKMPFVFHSDGMGARITALRNKIDSNINEAVQNPRHRPQTGVLGHAARACERNTRPQTSKVFSKIRGLKQKRIDNFSLYPNQNEDPNQTIADGEDKRQLKSQSLAFLSSKT